MPIPNCVQLRFDDGIKSVYTYSPPPGFKCCGGSTQRRAEPGAPVLLRAVAGGVRPSMWRNVILPLLKS